MDRSRKYFGMTGTQIGILGGMALLVLCIFGVLGYLIFSGGLGLGRAPQLPPTPVSTVTPFIIPTITPTQPPTSIPYEQLIPAGWTQYRTSLVELWLPPAYKVPKANTSGLTSLAPLDLLVSKPAARASLYAIWVTVTHEPLTTESLDTFLDVKFQSLPAEYRAVDRQTALINSTPAVRVVIEASVKTIDVNELLYVFQDRGTVWYLIYGAQINDFFDNLEDFEDSARTFRLVQ